MAMKKSNKGSKQLTRAKKLEATKPLTTSLYQACCNGKHISN